MSVLIIMNEDTVAQINRYSVQDDEVDALTTLERDVMKRTQQAQQTLARTYGCHDQLERERIID